MPQYNCKYMWYGLEKEIINRFHNKILNLIALHDGIEFLTQKITHNDTYDELSLQEPLSSSVWYIECVV